MKAARVRIVEPELLDVLPPGDRRALRSRHDLRRLNQWMNNPRIMARALFENLNGIDSPRIVELGAGDGDFHLSVARQLRPQWPRANVTLVDRLDAFDPRILERFKNLGWDVRTEISGVFEWLQQSPPPTADAIINNLFLHQFHDKELVQLLQLAARSARVFVALEPRRSWLSRWCGHYLWAIGCGHVTRNDARISIRAGFSDGELSALWPEKNWELIERPAGLFSHLFIARRKD